MWESLKYCTADSDIAIVLDPRPSKVQCWLYQDVQDELSVEWKKIIGQAIYTSSFGHNKRTPANFAYTDLMGMLSV